MSLSACAALVERGDPARFAATLAAPPELRPALWPLYAYNIEIARIPWSTAEPMLAEMRLQWWIDTLHDPPATSAHEVLGPLLPALAADPGLGARLAAMAEARLWDCGRAAFADAAALGAYLAATGGHLMWSAARALNAPEAAEPVVRRFAEGAALAGWLTAVAPLMAQGRQPLPDLSDAGIAALARQGLAALAAARRQRAAVPRRAAAALFPGWQAQGLLGLAARAPGRVRDGSLALAPIRERGGLVWRAFTGRW